MSKVTVTDFSKRTGSPFQNRSIEVESKETNNNTESNIKLNEDVQKDRRNELLEKINKKTAEIQSNKPKDGVFIEVVTHGAFNAPKSQITTKNVNKNPPKTDIKQAPCSKNLTNGLKTPLGFPSSANDIALETKTILESDPNLSMEVKQRVIEKLFILVSMVQHLYESKVRIATDFDRFKEKILRDELRLQKDHSEQLYKLNINFQTEFVQAIQQLKSELDIAKQGSRAVAETINNENIEMKSEDSFLSGDAVKLSD